MMSVKTAAVRPIMRRRPMRSAIWPVRKAPVAEPTVKAVRKRPLSAFVAPSSTSRSGAVGNNWNAAKKVRNVKAHRSKKGRVQRRSAMPQDSHAEEGPGSR